MQKRQIEISEELYKKIEKRVKESGEFKSVSEYIEFVLTELLKELEEEEQQPYTEEEEEEIKQRLRALGYID